MAGATGYIPIDNDDDFGFDQINAALAVLDGAISSAGFATAASLPVSGNWLGREAPAQDTGFTYRWNGTAWKLHSTNGWVDFAPTWTALAPGNGTTTAKYKVADGELACEVALTFGSTTSISGNVRMATPVPITTYPAFGALGYGSAFDANVRAYMLAPMYVGTNLIGLAPFDASLPWSGQGELQATNLFTWVAGDRLSFSLRARTA